MTATTTSPLAGKTALVIGGSRGIGAAITERLAADGATVAFTFASSRAKATELATAIATAGGRALPFAADSADAAALTNAVASATAELGGRLDVLVHSAGILVGGSIDSYAIEDFDRMFAVNVRGLFVATRAALPAMTAGGKIIAIGSNTRERGSMPGIDAAIAGMSTVYGTTKAAVARLVRGLAWDLAPRGITINSVEPGPTITDMNPTDGPHAERLRSTIPVHRMAAAAEIADFVSYLARPNVGYFNGASLTIDGGLSA